MIKIAGICILVSMLIVILKESGNKEMALMLSLATTVFILGFAFSIIHDIINSVKAIMEKTAIDQGILETVMKITGIAYVAQSASELCRDVGESALAGKVELFGKILICSAAIPHVHGLFNVLSNIL